MNSASSANEGCPIRETDAMSLSRRTVLLTGSAAAMACAAPAILRAAPDHTLRLGNIMPVDHPLNVRLNEAAKVVLEQTGGRVDIRVFPASQLGTDADMLSQLRSGALNFFVQTGLVVANFVPVAAITGLGFAFTDYAQVWRAVDGELGAHVRAAFEKVNLIAFERMWDNGFRQTTSSTRPIRAPNDIEGFKIRVPPSAMWTSLFKALGAAPTSIPWGETYSALQTRVADGLENPLAGIYFAKMYEVQKYLTRTNHMWDGFWFLANRRSFEAMSAADRDVVVRTMNDFAVRQRADVERLNAGLQADLEKSGLQFFDVDVRAFQDRLRESTFYKDWRGKFGDETWSTLERYTGRLGS